jgi:L-2-hydroxyglutarate oxidase LhgO
MATNDVVIIGGGIVGLATAYRLLQDRPDLHLVILEKEDAVAQHQTGRNSGVLHSGIYYKPGSLKAKNCRAGKEAMVAFCEAENVPYEICGKVIVATEETEVPTLRMIYERGRENGVDCTMVGAERLRELEPHAAGIQAIHVPETGIVDYRIVCERLAERIREMGGEIRTGARVERIGHADGTNTVYSTTDTVSTRTVVNCAGLQSDRVAAMTGTKPEVKIVPFRGEYYVLTDEAKSLCRNLIYPVPNPSFPFLGVHFTRMVDGRVECGPNAVLAFAREGYTKTDVNPRDLAETLAYPGFLKLAATYWKTGAGEMWRSFSKQAFVRALQKLIPEIRAEHLEPAPAGVRAQAVTRDGQLLDDFLIEESGSVINVCNAPSPAATSALNIGRTIADRLLPKLRVSPSAPEETRELA